MKRVSNGKLHRPQEIVPISCEAFEDYRLGAMHLTKLEIEAIRSGKPIATTNKRAPYGHAPHPERRNVKSAPLVVPSPSQSPAVVLHAERIAATSEPSR